RVDEGRGGPLHAVFQGVSAAVLPADDGRDGDGGAAGGGGDGDAGGQHEDDDRADHADCDGGAAAVRDPGRRADRRRGSGDEDPEIVIRYPLSVLRNTTERRTTDDGRRMTEHLWLAESGFV